MDRIVALAPAWSRVWDRRREVFAFVSAATILVGIIAFLLPSWYQAHSSLLPPSEDESGFSLTNLLRGVAVPGIKIPSQVTPAEVFVAVLESRGINEQIVNRFDLKKLYKTKFTVDAVKELRSHTQFKLTEAGTVELSVEDKNRQRAADMANAYVEVLDRFNRDVRMTKGRRTRIFVEARLAETRRALWAAEQRLVEYQSKNKTVAISPSASSSVLTAARLFGQRAALQVKLGVVRGYSQGTEEETQITQELAQIDRQLATLPETGIESVRLLRDVRTFEQVLELLTAQYEEARINEVRDVVTVERLDVASPPEKKSRPQRVLMIGAAFLLSLGLGIGWAVRQSEEQARPLMRAAAAE